MQLNQIKPAIGSKHYKKRVGRGIGSGLGKTAGRGHKGQKARAGGYHKVGFEGGQMPLQRRLPKRGFVSPAKGDTAEVRLGELSKMTADVIDIAALKAAGVVPVLALRAKVILSGEIKRKVSLKGLLVSKGARTAIEAAGGTIEDPAKVETKETKADIRFKAKKAKKAEAIAKAGAEIAVKPKEARKPAGEGTGKKEKAE